MDQWFFPEDTTRPVLDPRGHIERKYPAGETPRLPERAVVFCLGKGLPTLEERFPTRALLGELPGFITHTRVLGVDGYTGVCFLHGGYGAPQAACTMEALYVLGVREVLLVGLAGGFGASTAVGEVLLPEAVWSEEGVSRHYAGDAGFVPVDRAEGLAERLAAAGLRVRSAKTVTTDAVYRQTFFKEARWRELGCEAVDMEASAAATVAHCRGMRLGAALMVSDRHPFTESSPAWAWGGEDFAGLRERFLCACVRFALGERQASGEK